MEATLTLFDSPISGNAYKVRLVLANLGRTYRRVELDLLAGDARAESFRRENPLGRVPFLVDGDFKLAESNAILLYLARGTPLLPDDAHAQALIHQWMFFEQNQVEPSIATSRYLRRWRAGDAMTPTVLASQRGRGEASLAILERHLAATPFLVAGRYTVADISLFGYVPLSDEAGFPLEPYPSIRAWVQRVTAQPGYLPMA